MSIPQKPKPAKLVIGIFLKEKELISAAADKLSQMLGSIDMISPWFDFDYTSYYENEMGKPLFRRIFVFKDLIKQKSLASVKLQTNELEKEYSSDSGRRMNIDPGYMLHEKFVLATGKNYSHRIYIGRGIYADLTLIYTKGAFQTLEWTYPDYSSENIVGFLQKVRTKYIIDLRKEYKNE